jgi:Asp-tRNA(Asn)/Glu-tRNA(Gln) amidotransferase A subunit family amidase
MTEPCDLTATEARHLIGRKQLSPVTLLESCLQRIDRVDGALNAVVTLDAEGAMVTARAAEAAVMAGAALGPLPDLAKLEGAES